MTAGRWTAFWLLLGLGVARASSDAPLPDWNQYRGPKRDGVSRESAVSADWPLEGPPVLWKAQAGKGPCGLIVAHGRLYTAGNTNGREALLCYEAANGKELWKFEYDSGDPSPKNPGPASTPAADEARVFMLSRTGQLHAVDRDSGKLIWKKDFVQDFGAKKPPNGFCGSPLLYGATLVVPVCGTQATVAAFDRATGDTVWTWKGAMSNYASPLSFALPQGGEQLLIASDFGYHGLDPASGKQAWAYRWPTAFNINATLPVVAGDSFIVSSGYGKGCARLKPASDTVEEIWGGNKKEIKNLRSQCSPAVLFEGHLYGYDGDGQSGAKQPLVCVDAANGELKWSSDKIKGAGALMCAGGRLLVLNHTGTLALVEATPESYRELARAQLIAPKCWQPPVLVGGRAYLRNENGDLVCSDLAPSSNK